MTTCAAQPLEALAQGLALALQSVKDLMSSRDPNEWVDQERSPLGRKRHCRLVREGKLRGAKVAGHIYVRRKDIDALMEKNIVRPKVAVEAAEDLRAEVEAALREADARPSRRRKRAA